MNAYATDTDEIGAVSPHCAQTNFLFLASWNPVNPHFSHTRTSVLSHSSNNLSFRSIEAPYAIKQSRSISPNLRPPPRALPSVGCFVNI